MSGSGNIYFGINIYVATASYMFLYLRSYSLWHTCVYRYWNKWSMMNVLKIPFAWTHNLTSTLVNDVNHADVNNLMNNQLINGYLYHLITCICLLTMF